MFGKICASIHEDQSYRSRYLELSELQRKLQELKVLGNHISKLKKRGINRSEIQQALLDNFTREFCELYQQVFGRDPGIVEKKLPIHLDMEGDDETSNLLNHS